MMVLCVRCPGSEKVVDSTETKPRCPDCGCRVPVEKDGRLFKHEVEVEVVR
jgi:hypothetical protein